MKSDVYFVKVGTRDPNARRSALNAILEKADPFSPYKKDEFIPIKLTIGDTHSAYHISPDLVRLIVSSVKKKKGRPFLFDTSVIYKGGRQNAVDHLNLVHEKGFGFSDLGAPFVIADGVFGQDGREYRLGLKHIDKVKVPSFIGMLDSLLVLSHATGHIVARYAGAIKNVAMGMSCRPTKQVQHSSVRPSVISSKCTACGLCIINCPVSAIAFVKGKAFIDQAICVGCGECICACNPDAIFINWREDSAIFSRRMVDTAGFILSKFKNAFFINFAFDITKECDCISTKDDIMVSGNLGILASADPLSVDKATMDLIAENKKTDYFDKKPDIYSYMFEYAKERKLGNPQYNLIEV